MQKVALVTGASRGIGMSIATTLAQHDWFVVGTATTESGASDIQEAVNQHGEGIGVRLNLLSEPADIEQFVKRIVEQTGGIALLVNNAGITQDASLFSMTAEQWQHVMTVNLSSPFWLSKYCLKSMLRKKWGRIINISSVVASTGNKGQCNYSAAKAGIEGMTRTMALEVASRNITVNAIAPGFIETSMTAALPEAHKDQIKAQIPVASYGQPHTVAQLVNYLASDHASYMTGQVLHINGGLYCS